MAATTIFQELLKKIKDDCDKIDKYLENGGATRPWMIPKKLENNFDPFDIPGIKDGFDRQEPNDKYIEELEKEKGTINKCASYKFQICYVTLMERSFRSRHASFVRCTLHSAGRRKGQGKDRGVHVRGVLNWANDLGNAK